MRALIEEDLEQALTFLISDKPWLSEAENLRHKALFLDLTSAIRASAWLDSLIAYWHQNRSAVITLNYDTVIERVASSSYQVKRPGIPTGQLYPIRFTPAVVPDSSAPSTTQRNDKPLETFKLFELHGSINWFYSGRPSFFGEELFYVPCNSGVNGVFDIAEGINADGADWSRLAGNARCGRTILASSATLVGYQAVSATSEFPGR